MFSGATYIYDFGTIKDDISSDATCLSDNSGDGQYMNCDTTPTPYSDATSSVIMSFSTPNL